MKYRTIVADPPWDHSDGTGINFSEGGKVTSLPYQTMTLDEIRSLPVRDLSNNIDQEAHLYLWTTGRYLPDSFGIVESWGFEYIATLAWCKPSRGFSTGGRFQNNLEFVLFCARPKIMSDWQEVGRWLRSHREAAGLSTKEICARIGAHGAVNHGGALSNWENGFSCPTWDQWLSLKSVLGFGDDLDEQLEALNGAKGVQAKQVVLGRWFTWGRGSHSSKPEAFLDMVETVSPGPYLELFARRQRLGWDTWGNEALNHAGLVKTNDDVWGMTGLPNDRPLKNRNAS